MADKLETEHVKVVRPYWSAATPTEGKLHSHRVGTVLSIAQYPESEAQETHEHIIALLHAGFAVPCDADGNDLEGAEIETGN